VSLIGTAPQSYAINPTTAAARLADHGFVFEGAIAFDPRDGTAFGMNQNGAAQPDIFTIKSSYRTRDTYRRGSSHANSRPKLRRS